ncbi:efflux transporter outer membrane subunit [methanotrophic endosymbiont of Bathymodiolus puteoserpentis (Logatchev)]|uniref:efflux transporter outer membrane subunit n=1 Tax=methanotrophic endosymbiont of Bathymodiolus puteoserpentis (Logatchev) TaxID=343235 RepID=UPI0013CB4AA4|nr:TolC family protein [methanotrophic endosymbiont of Bathymodiolus puteoserpentis (Logatchev)]SHE23463.1 RND efflux system, outer membrane lipoprotein, NodT [methanotrophic endosymbiont of Bathymodiolus puteoserpentis (Logatchev)]
MDIKPRLIIITALLAQSCAMPINKIPTPIITPEKFSQPGKSTYQEYWWLAFNDPQLNQLIDSALDNNFSLLSTYNRLEQAQAIANKTKADLIPSITAALTGQQNYSAHTDASQFSLGLNASYEVDLWGRIRAHRNASDLDVRIAQENLNTAAISLSAEVAIAWYRLIEQRSQLALLKQQIKTNKDNVDIVTSRFAGGQATAADVFQQQQILEARRGDQNNVLSSIKLLEYQLAILTGNTPTLLVLPEQDQLPDLPAQPQTGLTSDLIQRRPDLRSAYFRVQAADQRTAAAIADRFPKLSLSVGIDTTAPNLQSLFNNWIATLAGNLILPIVDGGRRVAEVDRNRAVAAEALNNYATALQQAIQEVEDALIQEHQQQKLIISLNKQHQLSEQATLQIRLRYMYGAIDFLRVLTTQVSQQSLERSQILAKRQLLEYRIQLYRALAGSWELNTLANNKENTDA